PGGFASARDIAAITVNRWSHGYAYSANSLYEDKEDESIPTAARQPARRVTIANSDAQWDAYAHVAIDQAARAVRELPGEESREVDAAFEDVFCSSCPRLSRASTTS